MPPQKQWFCGVRVSHQTTLILVPHGVVLRLDKKSVDTLRIANQDINVIAQ